MFQPDEWQQKALLTWYPVDNPLHLDSRHPCIKLAGEAGEILDLYGKEEYKPNFSWWNCKHCGCGDASHSLDGYKRCPYLSKIESINVLRGVYTPLILDELGDYSYYLRILAYQKEVTFKDLCKNVNVKGFFHIQIDKLLSELNINSARALGDLLASNYVFEERLQMCTYYFLAILDKLNIPLEQVLELNYKKLNSEETNHGWKSATVKTRS